MEIPEATSRPMVTIGRSPGNNTGWKREATGQGVRPRLAVTIASAGRIANFDGFKRLHPKP